PDARRGNCSGREAAPADGRGRTSAVGAAGGTAFRQAADQGGRLRRDLGEEGSGRLLDATCLVQTQTGEGSFPPHLIHEPRDRVAAGVIETADHGGDGGLHLGDLALLVRFGGAAAPECKPVERQLAISGLSARLLWS